MPLLGLSVGDECKNKIIPSGFLMSVVLWVLFQTAGEPGTPPGAAEQWGVCSRQSRVAPLEYYSSAGTGHPA